MKDELLETWNIHHLYVLSLLEAVAKEAFDAPEPGKGRRFALMFAHLHSVRVMWLQSAAGPGKPGAGRLEKGAPVDWLSLRAALCAHAFEPGGRVRGFKPHAPAFLGYLIAHESYHHGEIGSALREQGYPLDRNTAFGLWEWAVR